MNTKLLFGAAALAGFVILSTPAVTQTSGCMPANCPGAKEPSTTGQARDKAQPSPAKQKTMSLPKSTSEHNGGAGRKRLEGRQ